MLVPLVLCTLFCQLQKKHFISLGSTNAKTCFGSDSMTTSSREEGYKTCSWLWLRGLPGLSTITLRAKARAAECSTLTRKSLILSDFSDKMPAVSAQLMNVAYSFGFQITTLARLKEFSPRPLASFSL